EVSHESQGVCRGNRRSAARKPWTHVPPSPIVAERQWAARGLTMQFFFLAGTAVLAAMAVTGAGAQPPDSAQGNAVQNNTAPADATQRLNRETNERLRRQLEERQRVEAANRAAQENNARIDRDNERRQQEYQERMRARDAAIAAEQARYDAEMARFRAQQAETGRQNAGRASRSSGGTRANTGRAAPQRSARNARS